MRQWVFWVNKTRFATKNNANCSIELKETTPTWNCSYVYNTNMVSSYSNLRFEVTLNNLSQFWFDKMHARYDYKKRNFFIARSSKTVTTILIVSKSYNFEKSKSRIQEKRCHPRSSRARKLQSQSNKKLLKIHRHKYNNWRLRPNHRRDPWAMKRMTRWLIFQNLNGRLLSMLPEIHARTFLE